MKTNKDRIEKDIMALGAISCVEGIGCPRYTYTDEFAKARDYIMKEMKDAGLSVVENEIGMVVGKLEGKNPGLPAVMTGSHFDTVATGGKFDGAAGVVAALETARVFKEEGFVPERPVLFVALPEEEGSRFGSGLFGSRAICGQLYDDELNRFKDRNGISFAEAMKAYGLDPSKVDNVRMNKEDLKPHSLKVSCGKEKVEYSNTVDVTAVCNPRQLGQLKAYIEGWAEPKEDWE